MSYGSKLAANTPATPFQLHPYYNTRPISQIYPSSHPELSFLYSKFGGHRV